MRKVARLIPTAALLSLAAPAEAHLVTTGLGPVYDGIAHLVLSPADLALVVALTLLAGMRGARVGRSILAVLPISWLAGGVTGLTLPAVSSLEWTTGAGFLLVGALVAADWDLSVSVVAALAATIGALHGFLTGAALSQVPSAGLELLGTVVALLVVITLVAGLVVSLRAYWARIAVRVLGSWVAATGLLMLGWTLRSAR
jgi:hydrogenase/urease accessory protein HupE